MDLRNKIAVVTGARGGLGSLLVKKLESEGMVCISIDKEECDFTKPQEVEKLGEDLKSKYPKIDFLFNVAGIGIYKSVEDLTIDDWNISLAINLTAPFILTKNLLPSVVINFGSGMGVMPTPNRSAYCVSKFGLRGLSLSLAKELKEKNIDVVLLTLGSIMTSFGTGGLDKRHELEKSGKKYLSPGEVIDRVVEIAKAEKREEEYVMYPEGYGE